MPEAPDLSEPYEAEEAAVQPATPPKLSDGQPWRKAEGYVRHWLESEHGLKLEPKKVEVGESYVELDGFSDEPLVICEIYTRLGYVARTTTAKACTDAAKLAWLRETKYPKARAILAIANDELERVLLQGTGWMVQLFRHFDVEVINAELTEDQRAELHAAEANAREGMKA